MGTALMFAVNTGSRQAVEYMIEHGAQWQQQNEDGQTVLSLALQRDDARIVETLAKFGAELSEEEMMDLDDRWFMAVEENNFKAIDCMLMAKFNTNRPSHVGEGTACCMAAKA